MVVYLAIDQLPAPTDPLRFTAVEMTAAAERFLLRLDRVCRHQACRQVAFARLPRLIGRVSEEILSEAERVA